MRSPLAIPIGGIPPCIRPLMRKKSAPSSPPRRMPIARTRLRFSRRNLGGELEIPLGEHEGVFAIETFRCRRRIDDQRTVQPHRHLDGRIGVGVIPAGSGWFRDELVGERLSWIDRRLAETGDAIHLRADIHAVPVDRGGNGEIVFKRHANRVAFSGADLRTGHLTVVSPNPNGDIVHQRPFELGRSESVRHQRRFRSRLILREPGIVDQREERGGRHGARTTAQQRTAGMATTEPFRESWHLTEFHGAF